MYKKAAQNYYCNAVRREKWDTDNSLVARYLLMFWSFNFFLLKASAVESHIHEDLLTAETATINNQVLFCVIQARMLTNLKNFAALEEK